MIRYFQRTPWLLKKLYPNLLWEVSTSKKELFLTFDDGPIPDLTEFVLDTLKKEEIKATFFCVGDNVRKHRKIFERIVTDGHDFGNHTYNHLNGWKTAEDQYLLNVSKCEDVLNGNFSSTEKKGLFRPPYGKIKRSAIRSLKDEFTIIMWSNLTADYDNSLTKEDCLRLAIKNSKKGSIVVFHDNLKASKNLNYVLPRYLRAMKEKGYVFKTLRSNI